MDSMKPAPWGWGEAKFLYRPHSLYLLIPIRNEGSGCISDPLKMSTPLSPEPVTMLFHGTMGWMVYSKDMLIP
jgi:hypothetical protein